MVRLSVAIQHHPSRPDLPRRLRAQLRCKPGRGMNTGRRGGGLQPLLEVVTDPDPHGPHNPWRTARECWRRTPDTCTHRLVIQDDIIPCRDFLRHAANALHARRTRVVSFYVGTNAITAHRDVLIAAAQGSSWVEIAPTGWVPALALAVPQEMCASLADFHDGTEPIADDDVYGRWLREQRVAWWATIPSLVDHDEDAPSLMRDPLMRGDRRAACWIGDCDPGLIDWTR